MHDQTLEPGDQRPPVSQQPCPRHYRLLRLLGRGGMGSVYEALDQRLQRRVAIKFLQEEDPERVARFVREGLALAQLEHEHLCKIHEMGEVDRKPYMVMQLIKGVPLSEAAAGMELREKLILIRQIALALHHAHRNGVIHRDLKPSNIMVETLPDGGYKPYVLDFGIARWQSRQDLTAKGDVLGTPGYMAPEQARGELERQNQMTDVYGLGATLYFLLEGRAPFEGTSPGEVLLAVMTQEPPGLQKTSRALPVDIGVMVGKCLSKNPLERYGSALELADDLDRFLNGEAIMARSPSPYYRIRKKVKKHRTLVMLGIAAVVLPLLALGWGAWRTAQREAQTRELTAQVKEVEALARYSQLSRRHDIRPDRRRLLAYLADIREKMERAGRGPGNYALGRGYLAMSQFEEARQYLERSWQAGFSDEQLIWALSLCYSHLYRATLSEIDLVEPGAYRQRLQTQAGEWRQRALTFMAKLPPDHQIPPHYLAALMAYCEQDYEEALSRLDQVAAEPAWFFEVPHLRGDIRRAQARLAARTGDDETAGTHFRQALAAYAEVREVAASDPKAYKAAAETLLGMMVLKMFAEKDPSAYVQEGLQILAQARMIQPDDPRNYLLAGRLYSAWAQRLSLERLEAEEQLEASVRALERAISLGGDRDEVGLYLGAAYRQWAAWLSNRRLDPVAKAQRAIAALSQVKGKYLYLRSFHLGSSHQILARHRARSGDDAIGDLQLAAAHFRNAVEQAPERIEARVSLAQCLYHLAKAEPESSLIFLEEAQGLLVKVLSLKPGQYAAQYLLGRVLLLKAEGGVSEAGMLHVKDYEQASAHLEAGIAINPQLPHAYEKLSWAHLLRAQWAWQQGEDPTLFLDAGVEVCRSGLDKVAKTGTLLRHLAALEYFRGKFQVRSGQNPGKAFRIAEETTRQVLQQRKSPDTYVILASIDRLRAEYALDTGDNPRPHMDAAKVILQKILKARPDYSEAHRSMGRLWTLEARYLRTQGKNPGSALEAASQSLARTGGEALPVLLAKTLLVLEKWAWNGQVPVETKALITALEGTTPLPESQAALAALESLAEEMSDRANGVGDLATHPFYLSGRAGMYLD